MQNLRDLDKNELSTLMSELGAPAYRAGQIFKWTHGQGAASYGEMTDIPKALREKLSERFSLASPEMLRRQIARDGTRKYLWGFADGNCVESVLMHYEHGNTICISTQAGCRMGCVFCASTIGGKIRDLTPGEIIEQVIFSAKDAGVKISNIVLMGTGEPLDNYDHVIKFLRLVNDRDGQDIGLRHISLSTSGLVNRIRELAKLDLQITLSVSLHAPNNTLRNQIMPVNRRWPVEELMAACADYIAETNRRISYEYALIRGFNDTIDCAKELVSLLHGTLAHVNLIRLNSIDESPLKPSTTEDTQKFCDYLNSHGVTTTVRRRLGFDIDASCGQLRRKYQQTEKGEDK